MNTKKNACPTVDWAIDAVRRVVLYKSAERDGETLNEALPILLNAYDAGKADNATPMTLEAILARAWDDLRRAGAVAGSDGKTEAHQAIAMAFAAVNKIRADLMRGCLAAANMDATDGPICGCGQPSTHQSGWCGTGCDKRPWWYTSSCTTLEQALIECES